MKRVRIQLQPGFVLHARAYRDTSQIIEVLTPDFGRIGLVARGVRSAKSKLKGVLQVFRPLFFSWSKAGELGTLTGVESAGPSINLTGECLFCGLYLNELIVRLVQREDHNQDLHRNYAWALAGLADDAAPAPVLRIFEKRLLEAMGYGLSLNREIDSDIRLQPDRWYEYRLEHGPVAVQTSGVNEKTGDGRLLFRGQSLLALADEKLDEPECTRDARRLLTVVLNHYLAGRSLKSREILHRLRQ